ncbi:DNA-3-methyladenine glycosylase I [Sphingobacterium allocomposti]|uniref:DNA-3-methyladenine glycosylase I n=1 Tax=Sphingobacterium allocomposti TaxID=415956 RepID=A0A5S5D5K6_9SPHI|nr:DNA-3-methyladenine glycosylase I [Sphingobacterium composti Yoo et al. 2007 non Ten et al. 2007]TYP90052.1 DNA-3-methyladenine glycosylase I [Sphingobacterium composti Yoo et al. 2007 non Ten et al. 2007]
MDNQQITRCPWCGTDELYVKYHDEEWGKPVTDDQVLFEFLVLESAQAGLSWITILRRREGYRRAFANFDYKKVAAFTPQHVEELVTNPDIIRHRGKIEATITNAQVFMQIQREFGSFYSYLYTFMPDGKPVVNSLKDLRHAATRSDASDRIAKDLKKRGVKFFGTTICYAFMQAVGMVNDHLDDCQFK